MLQNWDFRRYIFQRNYIVWTSTRYIANTWHVKTASTFSNNHTIWQTLEVQIITREYFISIAINQTIMSIERYLKHSFVAKGRIWRIFSWNKHNIVKFESVSISDFERCNSTIILYHIFQSCVSLDNCFFCFSFGSSL